MKSPTIYVVGVGGVGSWLTPSLCLLVKPENVVLIDGDILEKKNLNRQLFDDLDIGKYKSDALGTKYQCRFETDYYIRGLVEHDRTDWIFCCVDNNPARLAVLEACDEYQCKCIIAANETTSSEAYIYSPHWRGTMADPRVYYPEMESDRAGDPLARQIGCTGETQERNRQLVSANFSAAALAQNLFVLWCLNAKVITRETLPMMPYKFNANLSKLETHRLNGLNKKRKDENENSDASDNRQRRANF